MKSILYYLLILLSVKYILTQNDKPQHIKLNKHNLITIRGEITEETTSDIIRKLNKFSYNKLYIYITSPGGSVLSGIQIIDQIKSLKEKDINVVCIADFAASMAFAIFQSCPIRYIMSSSVLMQHQMNVGIKGSLQNVNNYLTFINQIDEDLDEMQANILQMDLPTFKNTVVNDWWISGKSIITNNAADSLVIVTCDSELVDQKEEVKKIDSFFDVNMIFSKCPISREPIDIIINIKLDVSSNQENIEKFLSSSIPSQYISKLKSGYLPSF